MLQKIRRVLNIGRIYGPYQNIKGQPVVYLVFNRTELQQVLFPLFLYHKIFFLTYTRRSQFEKAIYFMVSGETKITNNRSESERSSTIYSTSLLPVLPENAQGYLDLLFFKSWVVGFTISEGSFFY